MVVTRGSFDQRCAVAREFRAVILTQAENKHCYRRYPMSDLTLPRQEKGIDYSRECLQAVLNEI
jgi:hypothetical protein